MGILLNVLKFNKKLIHVLKHLRVLVVVRKLASIQLFKDEFTILSWLRNLSNRPWSQLSRLVDKLSLRPHRLLLLG